MRLHFTTLFLQAEVLVNGIQILWYIPSALVIIQTNIMASFLFFPSYYDILLYFKLIFDYYQPYFSEKNIYTMDQN